MACGLSAAGCFAEHVAASLPVAEREKGWWSMRCPIGHHGPPLRLRTGDHVHISYADLGHCPESEIYAWLVKRGVPAGCLKRPKDRPRPSRPGSDEKLADAILGEAFGEGTTTERLIRITILALGELPEGPMVDVIAANLGLKRRIVYQATAELRRRGRG
jgi:hypothetical protein